jgi:hypothetical protein
MLTWLSSLVITRKGMFIQLGLFLGVKGYGTRLKLSEDALKKEIPGANIRSLVLNLASLDAVRAAAAEVNAYPEQIDVRHFSYRKFRIHSSS